jgi:hypothetical protein
VVLGGGVILCLFLLAAPAHLSALLLTTAAKLLSRRRATQCDVKISLVMDQVKNEEDMNMVALQKNCVCLKRVVNAALPFSQAYLKSVQLLEEHGAFAFAIRKELKEPCLAVHRPT